MQRKLSHTAVGLAVVGVGPTHTPSIRRRPTCEEHVGGT